MRRKSPQQQLATFMARYTPGISALAQAILERMRVRLPGAVEMVYDNYNALVIGFGPTERPSEAIFSVALYPRWVNLFFLQGAKLPDPQRRLKGSGKQVRHVRLDTPAILDEPAVQDLITRAIERAPKPFDESEPGRMIIKSISPARRPRRPA